MSLIIMPNWSDHFQASQDEKEVKAVIDQLKNVADPFLLLSTYLPKWRSYSRQLGLDDLPSWSVFDALQRVHLTVKKPMQLDDLSWPKGAQFIRMFDRVVVLVNLSHYASVFFTYPKANQIDRIDRYAKGQLIQQLTVDDRGFISRVLDYQEGVLVKASYLSQSGAVVAEEDYQSGQVQALLPDGRVANYDEMQDLLVELMAAYLQSDKVRQLLVVDSPDNRAVAEKVQMEHLFVWLGQAKKEELVEAEQFWSGKAKLLLGQRNVGQETLGELLPPYPVVVANQQAQRKNQTLLYFQLAQMTEEKQHSLLAQVLPFILADENRTVVFEAGNKAALTKQLADGVKELASDSEKSLEEWLAHFVFLPAQRKEKRREHLLTACLYADLAEKPDLAIIAEAVGLGVKVATTVVTAYTPEEEQSVIPLDQLEDFLAKKVQNQETLSTDQERSLQECLSEPEQMKNWQERLVIKATEAK
ncbi:accessory Sec system glycosyltransferase Asp1 [Fructobacillus fructosus]|uniref:Accessory Sec system protein Asp1 n=1 Tax=Fructobacillus fructosus TaxID=1631 RepID=A0ABN9YM10_9LACO|nr:accessory Sec system glycosyltransferase Asp1 [Fructobacillus fructosus]MBD9364415.1 accessory Sec system glycosyltransferase Asp1 [Leuconostoc mesenteroides]MCK8638170.1 accessory Sec system glycosyltransferase Asp1 [Fructobacillus fructosus]CAK1224119.1 hypothetical protein R54839_PPFHFPJH_00106 [Fructobacillus fructosus]